MELDRHVYKRLAFSGLCIAFATLSGCPLINGLLDPPDAAFEAGPLEGEAPLTVLFVDASSPGTTNITQWQWDFGDGSSSGSRNPTHIYEAPGQYNVSLTVTSDVGTDTELRRGYIHVIEQPAADFSAMPTGGSAPLTVTFADTSNPGSTAITGWLWNFGDRTPTSAQQNPVHVYTAPGLYTVSLTVTTDVGENTMTKTEFINVAGQPVADFSAGTATSGVAPLTVMFRDESLVGTATINGWAWDFGDGNMATDQNPTHTYAAPGVYTVSLTIDTTAGNDTAEREAFIVVDEGPTAAFMGEPVMGPAPLTVAFTDTSDSGSQPVTARLWNFGDNGLLSTLANPTRTYTNPGVYSVSLRVTTAAGSNTIEQPDYITVLPGVDFTTNQTRGRGSLTVQFVDTSITGALDISAWAWDFGDGAMATEPNPEHTYAAPGIYDVTLTVTTPLGPSTATQAGLIVVEPETDFSADPASGPPPLDVTFTDETNAGTLEIAGWAWDFGDGNTSEEQSPMHSYATPGTYNVSLAATTALGAAERVKSGLIQVHPVPEFTASPQNGQGTLTVRFQDESNAGNLNILGWFWDFGDGVTSTQQNPAHTYGEIGTYDVSLTITTAQGDQVAEKPAFIKVGPIVDFQADKVSGEGNLTVTFTDLTEAGSLEIEAWAWEFGDGNTSDEQNPMHEYMPGLYSVSLTVTTSQGDTMTLKEDLILLAPRVVLGFVQPAGPAPFEASLLDMSETGTFEVTGWRWELGDGNVSEEQNPVHTYEDPGAYTVTLTLITNGGDFSKTEPNFITAQRGPTAAFTHSVSRGGDPEGPVTVSFTNMSLPGDAPILNQTWDFGESAMADEELAMEANPVVVYPGLAFDTIPQNVSLTVRTFIAADTLLRENLYGAPVAKSTLAPDLLDAADLTQIAADASGDVWASGTLPETGKAVLVRLNSDAEQRWGIEFNVKGALEIASLHAPGDGTVLVAGTWTPGEGDAIFLTRIDAAGETLWETIYTGTAPCRPSGLAMLADGTVVVAGSSPAVDDAKAPLFLLTCSAMDGKGMARQATALTATTNRTPIAAAVANTLYVADTTPDGTLLARFEMGSTGAVSSIGLVAGTPQTAAWNGATATALIATDCETAIRVYAAADGGTLTELLALPRSNPVALVIDGLDTDIIWLHRDETTDRWTPQRQVVTGG